MKKALATLFLSLFTIANILAQGCVTCTNTAAQLGQDASKGLNGGILYLVVVPFTFVAVVAFIIYRVNKANNLAEEENEIK